MAHSKFEPEFKGWKEGCWGLRSPAAVATADVIIWRIKENSNPERPLRGSREPGTVEVLLGRRGPGRFGAGEWMISIGGFIDPVRDASPLEAALRELREEVPGIKVNESGRLLAVTGPAKRNWRWRGYEGDHSGGGCQCADSARKGPGWELLGGDRLVQEIPIVTVFHLAEWTSGEPQASREVPETKWVLLRDLYNHDQEFFAGGAELIEPLYLALKHLIRPHY